MKFGAVAKFLRSPLTRPTKGKKGKEARYLKAPRWHFLRCTQVSEHKLTRDSNYLLRDRVDSHESHIEVARAVCDKKWCFSMCCAFPARSGTQRRFPERVGAKCYGNRESLNRSFTNHAILNLESLCHATCFVFCLYNGSKQISSLFR